MTFCDTIEKKCQGLRQAILDHPFVLGIGDGDLALEPFKYYVRQDYVYLIEFARVLAMASARADTLANQSLFAKLCDGILHFEMDLHRGYAEKFGISRKELAGTEASPTTVGYTQFLLRVANSRSFPEQVASILPCAYGYWEIATYLNERGRPEGAPLYAQWIDTYVSDEFRGLVEGLRDLADVQAAGQSPAVVAGMEAAYETSVRWEYLFWEQAYKLEEWPG